MAGNNQIYKLYKEMLHKYGHPKHLWPQWCDTNKDEYLRQIVAIGAILTQRTSWRNAEIALINLKNKDLISFEKIAKLDLEELTALIRTAGFYSTKPSRLQELCRFVIDSYGSLTQMKHAKLEYLREQLLAVYGIGPETADTLLLYALDKPSFIIDEYTKRFVLKYKITNVNDYNWLKKLFEDSLPKAVEIYQNYHILIIADQKGRKHCKMEIV